MFQFLLNGLCVGAVIAVVSLGFGLIYTTARVFHIAHAGVYVLSGYVLWSTTASWKLPLGIGIALALAVAAAAGVLIDWAVYQPLNRRAASSAVILISSIGVQIIFVNALALIFGNQPLMLRVGVERLFRIGSIALSSIQLVQLTVAILLTCAFWLFLKHTRAGHICRAVSDDETLAQVLGVRVNRVRLLVFGIGSFMAGVGSILIAIDVGMDLHVGFPAVLAAAVACIIGGLRNFLAPAAGGFLLGIVQSMIVWQTSAKWEEAVTFALLIAFLLFRRQGLFGVTRRAEEA